MYIYNLSYRRYISMKITVSWAVTVGLDDQVRKSSDSFTDVG